MKDLLMLLILSLFFWSCKKENTVHYDNYFEVGSNKYPLDKGYIEQRFFVDSNLNYHYILELYSDGIELDTIYRQDRQLNGSGHVVMTSIESPLNNGISTGTYLYNEERFTNESFYKLTYVVGLSYNPLSWDLTGQVENGTITLENNDGDYIIEIAGVDENQNKFNAYYKGNMDFRIRVW